MTCRAQPALSLLPGRTSRHHRASGSNTSCWGGVFVLLVCVAVTRASCGPDADGACNEHRICEFSSLEAYDYVRTVLFEAAGCSTSCIDQCECTCNQSGAVFDALSQANPPYCTSEICENPVIKRAMNYASVGWTCESVWTIALRGVYQLCSADDNGVCNDGACLDFYCTASKEDACSQTDGPEIDAQWLFTAYIVTAVTLFVTGSFVPSDTPVPSPDYFVTHFLLAASAAVLVVIMPVYSVSVSDPDLESLIGALLQYQAVCYAFGARVIGRGGATLCTSSNIGNPCYTVIQRVNTGNCGSETEFVAIGNEFETFGETVGYAALTMFLLSSLALVALGTMYVTQKSVAATVTTVAFLHLLSAAAGLAVIYGGSNAIDQSSYNDNDNRGQTAYTSGGFVALCGYPIIALLLDCSLIAWITDTPPPAKKSARPTPPPEKQSAAKFL